MKDELSIILEAMRRAQAKVAFYLEPGNRNAEKAFKEIVQNSGRRRADARHAVPVWRCAVAERFAGLNSEDDNTVSPDFARSS